MWGLLSAQLCAAFYRVQADFLEINDTLHAATRAHWARQVADESYRRVLL